MTEECQYILTISRSLLVLFLWALIAYPIWGFLVSDNPMNGLTLGPFVVNAISLAGNYSSEADSLDWRVFVFNLLTSGVLSLALLFAHQQMTASNAIIVGLACLLSLAGSFSHWRFNEKFMTSFDRRVTFMRVIFVLIVLTISAWGIAYQADGDFWVSVLVQTLVASTAAGACFLSMLFPHSSKNLEIGVGSPLLWLIARILLSGGIPRFWAWAFIVFGAFIVMQIGKNRHLGRSLLRFLEGVEYIETRSGLITLSLAVYQLILTLSSQLCEVCVLLRPGYDLKISSLTNARNMVLSQSEDQCMPSYWWRGVARANIASFIDPVLALYHSAQGEATCHKHYMYEQTGSVIIMILLLSCSCMYTVRRIKNSPGEQGFWQPIFFAVSGIMGVLFVRDKLEILSEGSQTSSIAWSPEAIAAMGISAFGAIFSSFVALFRIKATKEGHSLVRISTDRDILEIPNSTARWPLLIPLGLTIASAVLAALEIWHTIPLSNDYGWTSEIPARPITSVRLNNSVLQLLYPFSSQIRSLGSLMNCTGICESEIIDYQDQFMGTEFNATCLWATGASSMIAQGISLAALGHKETISFSLADIMHAEMITLSVLCSVLAILVILAVITPVWDDLALTVNLGILAILGISVPYRLLELRSFSELAKEPEWPIPTLCIMLIVNATILFHLRIQRTVSFLIPFMTAFDLETDYSLSGVSSIKEYLEGRGIEWPKNLDALDSSYDEIFTALEEDARLAAGYVAKAPPSWRVATLTPSTGEEESKGPRKVPLAG